MNNKLPKIALGSFLKDVPRKEYVISDKFTPQCVGNTSEMAMQDMWEKEMK